MQSGLITGVATFSGVLISGEFTVLCFLTEELFLATTPFSRVESPEYSERPRGLTDPFDANYMSLHEEQQQQEREEEEGHGSDGTLDE